MKHLYCFAKSFLGLACLFLFLSTGAVAQSEMGLFGDGSDGDVKISSFTTLQRDMYYRNLTIETGQTLNPNGFRIFVSGTLTMCREARISRDGNRGGAEGGTEGGAALSAGTLGGSGAGGGLTSPPVTNSLGGSGGEGILPTGGAYRPAHPPAG